MRGRLLAAAAASAFLISVARADDATASVQKTLKDQGFYYGEITGKKDADTTAAIRRYQIRNGLQVTGELDGETRKSIGVANATAAPKPTATPPPARAATPAPVTKQEDDRADSTTTQVAPPSTDEAYAPDGRPTVPDGYAPGPRGLQPDTSGVFDGTPFEVAPPAVQRQALIGAQTLLARRGYYRSTIDGVYGPGTNFAIRAFQARVGLEPSGRLDLETLAALGLLPGQRRPGFMPPTRIFHPRRSVRGEWIHDD